LAELKSFSEVSLELIGTLEDGPDKDDLQADIMSYQANRAESLGDAEKAISLNKEVLRIRKEHNKEDLLGHVTNNIGYCYNTANDHETSQQWFRESYDWWCSNGKQVPSFVRTNMARCMIYRDNFAAARVELAIAIPQLREEKDWAMLA
jgi:tetratricopeptide (TPR) repeat protein